jgi:hypothetical protein
MRNRVYLALVCVPLLALAACSNGGNATNASSTSTAAPQSTVTSASGLTAYTSPDHKYRLSYPSGWQVQTADGNPGKASFMGPNNQYFEVSDDASIPGAELDQLITQYCQAVQPGQAASHVVGITVTLGGQTWFKAPCSADAQPASELIVEVTTYKGSVYQLDYSSPGPSFLSDDSTFYTPMEQSFQFLT